jgi:hypothetical protein
MSTSTDARIDRYFTLAATDPTGFLAQFADDAVVTDEGRTHVGIAGIHAWRTSVPDVTYRVATVDTVGDRHDVRAEISGDFPGSPVTLVFELTFDGDRIRTLHIHPV